MVFVTRLARIEGVRARLDMGRESDGMVLCGGTGSHGWVMFRLVCWGEPPNIHQVMPLYDID
jgi:hypothetical protein